VKRREFIAGLGGAVTWPLTVRAQQGERARHIGVLTNAPENDPEDRRRMAAFLQALQKWGWREGDNLRIEYRRSLGKADNTRRFAAELVALTPDVILATGSSTTGPLLEATRTVPIVFVLVPDSGRGRFRR
jgi:putative ABC transport system substrate-binding protein